MDCAEEPQPDASPAGPDRHVELLYRGIQPYTLIDFQKFNVIYRLLQQCRSLPGDIGELGVYRGGISAALALAAPEKRLHLFDTFTGLRQAKTPGEPHRAGDFADTSLPDVLSLLPAGHPVTVHAGWFPECVTEELRGTTFAFLHIDGDYYESTRDALDFFYPSLSPGGVLVFDDWEWEGCPGVKRALLEGHERFGYRIETAAPLQAYVRKPG